MAVRPNSDQSSTDKLADRRAAEQDVLLREIDDAVREDELADMVRRHGARVLGVVMAVLVAFGGYLWWQNRQDAAYERTSEDLITAMDHLGAGNMGVGEKALEPLAKSGDAGASAAARLLQAGVALEQGKRTDAVRIYAQIARDDAAPKPYRELASIREVATNFDAMKPDDVISRLKPLAVPGNPWFGSAGELVGIAYLKQGQKDLAGPLFAAIAKSKDVPDTLRGRARQMAGLLGVDAVEDGEVKLASPDNAAPAAAKP